MPTLALSILIVIGCVTSIRIDTGQAAKCHRLRGGQDDLDDPEALGLRAQDRTGRMTREEVLEKLNKVPAFCIMLGDGSVISLPDRNGADGDECCTWFLDAAEAAKTFNLVKAANPDDKGLRLVAHGLGDALVQCGGMPGDPGSSYEGKLILAADKNLVAPIQSALINALKQDGIDPGAWQVPMFIGEELAQAGGEGEQRALPIFLSPYDLRDAYTQAGVLEGSSAAQTGPKVLELRMLVKYMLDEPKEYPNAWRAVEFHPTANAKKLVGRIAEAEAEVQG